MNCLMLLWLWIMSTAKRAPTLSSVLLFVLLNGVPSEGQSVLSPDLVATSVAVMYPSRTMYPTPTSTPQSTEAPTVLSREAIIGIVVGGGSVLGSALILCLCICVCCLCTKARQNKKFNPSLTEKQPIDGGSPAYHNLTPPDLSLDLVKNEEFEMQVNVALSFEDVDSESAGHNIKPTELFALNKSASTSNIQEMGFDDKDDTQATNLTSETNSVPSVRLPELKGYVEMSSAGSIQLSKSVGDVTGLGEEQDVGIYVEPDRTAAAILLQSELYRDPPPAAPPKLHPKTPSITAIIATENSTTKARHEPMLSPTEEVGGMEDYVEPDVFRIDRQTQEEIDSYYNKDTIESIRQGRGLSDVIDPSDALYTSVNSSTPTPSHQHDKTDLIDDDHLGSRDEFLSGSRAKLSSAGAVAMVSESGEGYYNVKHHTDDSEGEDDYYNSVPGASSSQPLLDPEDNQYIYIQNSEVPRTSGATPGKPAVAAKPRHLSSPVPQPKKKYINLGPTQRQILQEKLQVKAVNKTTIDETTHVTVVNGGSMDAASDIDDSAAQPLYENLHEDEEDEGGKEIYENIVR